MAGLGVYRPAANGCFEAANSAVSTSRPLGRFEPVASSVLPGAPVDADDEADD